MAAPISEIIIEWIDETFMLARGWYLRVKRRGKPWELLHTKYNSAERARKAAVKMAAGASVDFKEEDSGK